MALLSGLAIEDTNTGQFSPPALHFCWVQLPEILCLAAKILPNTELLTSGLAMPGSAKPTPGKQDAISWSTKCQLAFVGSLSPSLSLLLAWSQPKVNNIAVVWVRHGRHTTVELVNYITTPSQFCGTSNYSAAACRAACSFF